MSAACGTGKRIYFEERLANRAITVAAKRGELPVMRHYPCPVCGWWHLSCKHRGPRPDTEPSPRPAEGRPSPDVMPVTSVADDAGRQT